jgi:modulator of drug activity B
MFIFLSVGKSNKLELQDTETSIHKETYIMKKIFIINGGQEFAHSGGKFNQTVTDWTIDYLTQNPQYEVKTTAIQEEIDLNKEVEKFVWADLIIYHTPVWWFQLPNLFKKYIDDVFTAGHNKGIYKSDGRSRTNPDINYGTGGLLHGRKYMLTTSWNAPATAFTLPGEFFNETSVDDGVMFGFHKMNKFVGMEKLSGFHFHDVEKGATSENISIFKKEYTQHLDQIFKTLSL